MTPLERRIKAAALLAIRRIKPWQIESKSKKICFLSDCNGILDQVLYERATGEYTVKYEMSKSRGGTPSKVYAQLEVRSLSFKLN
jgi:hypothetical protein